MHRIVCYTPLLMLKVERPLLGLELTRVSPKPD